MHALTENLLRESRRPHGGNWLELWQIDIDVTAVARLVVALVNHSSTITFGGTTYYPFPISRGPIEWNSEGNVPRTTLTLGNADRQLVHYLEQGHGMRDRRVTWRLVHEDHLADSADRLPMQWITGKARVTSDAIVVELEARGFQSIQLPRERFMRDRCTWRFRSDECAYEPDTALGADYRTCNKSLADCELRGDDEVVRGLPRMHPMQYGGFPGLPRRVR